MGSLGTFAKKGCLFCRHRGREHERARTAIARAGDPCPRMRRARKSLHAQTARPRHPRRDRNGRPARRDYRLYGSRRRAHAALLRRAEEEGKTVLSRAAFLGLLARTVPARSFRCGMSRQDLLHGDARAYLLAGGAPVYLPPRRREDVCFGNVCRTGGEYLITEACEFRRSFLSLESDTAVILNYRP